MCGYTKTNPWTLVDVTDDIDRDGAAERERQAKARVEAVQAARDLLKDEILCRETGGEPPMLKTQAQAFLTSRGVTQKISRQAMDSSQFEIEPVPGPGHPKIVRVRR
jgi:hypothetical protein